MVRDLPGSRARSSESSRVGTQPIHDDRRVEDRGDLPSPLYTPLRGRSAPTLAIAGHCLALLTYVALALWIFAPVFFGDASLSASGSYLRSGPFPREQRDAGPIANNSLGDSLAQFEPWLRFAATNLARTGRVPLWKDATLCGAPFLGNHQSALLWPPHLIAILCGIGVMTEAWLAACTLILGALGAYALARWLRASYLAAIAAGLLYGFGGFAITQILHPHAHVACLLPWLALCADRLVVRRSWPLVAPLALVAALQHLGGHAETALHCQLAVAVLALARAVQCCRLALPRPSSLGPRVGEVLVRVAPCAAGLVLGACLAGIQLVPFLEYLGESDTLRFRRMLAGRPLGFGREHAVIVITALVAWFAGRRFVRAKGIAWFAAAGLCAALIAMLRAGQAAGQEIDPLQLLVPDRFGPPNGYRGGFVAYLANSGFMGISLAFAVVGAVVGRRTAELRALWLTLLFGLACGLKLPVVDDLLSRLPVLKMSVNMKWSVVGQLAAALLTAVALDACGRVSGRSILRAAIGVVVIHVAFLFGFKPDLRPLGGTPDWPDRLAEPVTVAGGVVPFERGDWSMPTERMRFWAVGGYIHAPADTVMVQLQIGPVDRLSGTFVVVPETTAPIAEFGDLRPPFVAVKFNVPAWGQYRVDDPLRIVAVSESKRLFVTDWFDEHNRPRPAPGDGPLEIRAPRGMRGWFQIQMVVAAALAAVLGLWLRGRFIWLPAIVAIGLGVASQRAYAEGFLPLVPKDRLFPEAPAMRTLRELRPQGRYISYRPFSLMTEVGAAFGLLDVIGYDALTPWRVEELLHAATEPPRARNAINTLPATYDCDFRLLGLLAVRGLLHPQLPPPGRADHFGRKQLARVDFHFLVHENDRFLPRARLVRGVEVEPDDERARHRLKDPAFPLADRLMLAEGEPIADGAGKLGDARIVVDGNDRVVIEVDAREPCHLVLADTFFPGWRVLVDGKDRRIKRAYTALRAVEVEAGHHVLDFRYEPDSVRLGLLVSEGAAVAVLLLLMSRTTGTRRRKVRADPVR